MKILFIILIIFCFSYSNVQSKQEVVNDTLWTLQMETQNYGFTCSVEHNRFYTTNGYYIGQERFTYIASHSLDDGSELVRKEYGSIYLNIVYYKLKDKIIVNVQDSLFFLDPVTLDVINKVKLPSYSKNGEEISDYTSFLDNFDIFIVNKYLKISPYDKSTNRRNVGFIYDIENNEYIRSYNSTTTNHFNADESVFISAITDGFDIYNSLDWSKLFTFRTEYKYIEDEFKERYLDYVIEHMAYSPDGSRVALAVYKETENETYDDRNRIEIFNLITNKFEESFQIYKINGLSNAKGRAMMLFLDNENIILKRDNHADEKPKVFLYKLNTNGNLIEYPQQNIKIGNFIKLGNNDILSNNKGGSHYSRINVTPEILTNVENINLEESIYPNPTNDIINIDTETPTNIELFDIFGNKLLEDYSTKLDISHLSPGTYYIRYLGQTRMVVKM